MNPGVQEFEQFHAENRDLAAAMARRIVSNEQDAEDVAQDALIRAWRFWDQFDERSTRSTWFARIVINTALVKLRVRRRHSCVESLNAVQVRRMGRMIPLMETLESAEPIAERGIILAERRAVVADAAEHLPEDYRQVYERIVAGDWETGELEPNKIRVRRWRMIQLIRERLAVAA